MTAASYDRIAEAIRFLDAHLTEQPSLGAVAQRLGISEFHLHRLFHSWAGVTPKDFVQHLTLVRARQLLAADHAVLETSHALGLSGPSRLHDLFVTLEGMTPGEYKRAAAGLTVAWGVAETPLGEALFAATTRGLCGLSFLGDGPRESAVAELAARWPGARLIEAKDAITPYAEAVSARLRGEPGQPIGLLLKGTPFQLKVWEALLAVPEGHVTTYQALAEAAGAPGASRAVGSAMAANAIGYLIPCHRVIRATGAIGDYRWGVARKEALLALEGARRAQSTSR